MAFEIVSYHYHVMESAYEGHGSVGFGSGDAIKIYYCPFYPAFSLTSNTVPLLWLFMLYILGFGILEINKWLGVLQNRS